MFRCNITRRGKNQPENRVAKESMTQVIDSKHTPMMQQYLVKAALVVEI